MGSGQRLIPARETVSRLLEFIDDVIDDLGSRREPEYAQTPRASGRAPAASSAAEKGAELAAVDLCD
jgi:hypothetical protein